jgi:hypothetical protein
LYVGMGAEIEFLFDTAKAGWLLVKFDFLPKFIN